MSKKGLLFLLSTLWLMGGCVKDDKSDCNIVTPPVTTPGDPNLDFGYTNSTGGQELASRVKGIKLYVFDENTGLLVDVITLTEEQITQGKITPTLPDGKYTIVAVGTGGSDLTAGGFKAAQAAGTDPTAYPAATVGTTTLGDFRLMLDTNPPTTEGAGYTPKADPFDDMFFATQTGVTVENGVITNDNNFNFAKSSSLLDIQITGVQHINGAKPLRVFVMGKNGALLYDGTLDPNALTMRYDPYSQTNDTDTVDVSIKTLRLDMSKETSQPVLLYIQDGNGQNVVDPINVISAIRQVKNADGSTKYNTQADIDREDIIPLKVALSPAADGSINVRVTVNGFRPEELGTH